MLLTIMFLVGTSKGSDNSEDLETSKHPSPSQNTGFADGIKEPLKIDSKKYVDIIDHESKEHFSKDLPEVAVLGGLAGLNTKLDTGADPAEAPKNETEHLNNENSESPDVPKNATESIEIGETEKPPVFLKENEISGNEIQSELAGNIRELNLLDPSPGKPKATQDPVTDQPNHQMLITEDSATKDSTTKDSTIKPSKVTKGRAKPTNMPSCYTTKVPKKGTHGKASKEDGRMNRKIIKEDESSESNDAFRNSDASLACFILVLVVVMANNLFF